MNNPVLFICFGSPSLFVLLFIDLNISFCRAITTDQYKQYSIEEGTTKHRQRVPTIMKILEQRGSMYNSDIQKSNITSVDGFTYRRNGATAEVTSLGGFSRNAPVASHLSANKSSKNFMKLPHDI